MSSDDDLRAAMTLNDLRSQMLHATNLERQFLHRKIGGYRKQIRNRFLTSLGYKMTGEKWRGHE